MLTSRMCAFLRGPLLRMSLCLSVLCLWTLRGADAAAQADAAEPAAYVALIDQGFVEYEAGHFPEARALFSRANALFTNARVLRSLGMVEFELRNYLDSARLLEMALASSVQPLTVDLQQETRQLLDRARGFLVRLQLILEPSTASVSVDGGPLQTHPEAPLLLEAGDHTLMFRAPGFVPERRMLKARGGDEQTWHVALASAAEPVVARAPADTVPSLGQESTTSTDDQAKQRFLLVVPRLTLVLPGSGTNKYSIQCSSATCPPPRDDPNQQFSRNAAAMLGVDVMFALSPKLRIGIGMHAQLNKTMWEFSDGSGSFELGRVMWFPVAAEYRIRLSPEVELPLRIHSGLALLRAGRDLKVVRDAIHEQCQQFTDTGGHCTAEDRTTPGAIVGMGPGLTYQLGKTNLRADFTLGYQWTRTNRLERSSARLSSTEKEVAGTLIAALSIGVEI